MNRRKLLQSLASLTAIRFMFKGSEIKAFPLQKGKDYLWRAHGQMSMQLLQTISQPMAPPELQDYASQFLLAGNLLMKKICKDFGINDPSSILPEPRGLQERVDQMERQFEQMKAMQQRQLQAGPSGQPANIGGVPQVQAEGAPMAGSEGPTVTQ